MRWPAQNKESKYTDTFLKKYMFGCVDILLTNQMALTEKQTLKPKPKRFDGNHSCLMHFGMFGFETTHAVVNSYITVVHRSFFVVDWVFSFSVENEPNKKYDWKYFGFTGRKKNRFVWALRVSAFQISHVTVLIDRENFPWKIFLWNNMNILLFLASDLVWARMKKDTK